MNQHEPNASDHSQNAKAAPKCPFARNAGTPMVSLADTLKESTKEAHARAVGREERLPHGTWPGQERRLRVTFFLLLAVHWAWQCYFLTR